MSKAGAFILLISALLCLSCGKGDSATAVQEQLSALASEGRWQDLEKETRRGLDNYTALNWYNLSKAWQGRLTEDLFKVAQHGPWGLIYIPKDHSASPCLAHVMYACGNMAAAQNLAFNALYTDDGIDRTMLRMLARIEMMRGCDAISQKYQRQLGEVIEEDDDIRRGRRDMAQAEESFVLAGSPFDEILRILRANPDDSIAMEYALSYLLLAKDMKTTRDFVEEFFGKGALKTLPTPVQEAILFYSEMTRNLGGDDNPPSLEWCREHGLTLEVERRFEAFQNASLQNNGAAPAGYKTTFWHYFLYTEI